MPSEHPLARRVRRLRSKQPVSAVDGPPGSPEHAYVTRARLEEVEREIANLRASVDRVVWAVIAAGVLTLAARIVGG